MGHRLAHDEERPAQIDVQDAVPFGGGDPFQGPELKDPGGIDQRIQSAQSLCRGGDSRDHGGIIADVHRDRQEAGPVLGPQTIQGLGQIGDGDTGTDLE